MNAPRAGSKARVKFNPYLTTAAANDDALLTRVLVEGLLVHTFETALHDGAVLKLFAGPEPATCLDDDPQTCLAELPLPPKPLQRLNTSDGGRGFALAGPLAGVGGELAGQGRLARSWRLIANGQCVAQGSVGAFESSTDLRLENPAISAGNKLTIYQFGFFCEHQTAEGV
jgi:hypothetical protein